jgi:hypothetical protein
MSSYVDPSRETGKLYVLVSMADALAHMIGSPLVESIWARAIDLGGDWLVLQFVVLSVSLCRFEYQQPLLTDSAGLFPHRCHPASSITRDLAERYKPLYGCRW